MKTTLIPYAQISGDGWWTGLDLYNHSTDSSIVSVEVQDETGLLLVTLDSSVEGKTHLTLSNEELAVNGGSRVTILINHDESVYPTVFIGQGVSFVMPSMVELDTVGKL